MDQSVKVRLDQGQTRSVKSGRGVRQRRCLAPTLFNFHSEYLTKEAVKEFGGFNTGRKVICTVKYAVDLVLLAKKETVLQGKVDTLTEIGT